LEHRLTPTVWADAMQKVMEARRAHVARMEEKMKENKGGVDPDQALAMGAHTVRETERRRGTAAGGDR
jgi:hypothetical protein